MKNKTTVARKGTATKQALERRAAAIVASSERYDIDTREAVSLALSNLKLNQRGGDGLLSASETREGARECERRLHDLVTRAEAGETIVESGAGPEADEVARKVIELLDLPGLPDFLLGGLMVIIHTMEKVAGAKLWKTIDPDKDEPELSAERLARVVRYHAATTIEFQQRLDLAGLIAAVLSHPDTPAEIHNALADSFSDLDTYKRAAISAGFIRALLDQEGGA